MAFISRRWLIAAIAASVSASSADYTVAQQFYPAQPSIAPSYNSEFVTVDAIRLSEPESNFGGTLVAARVQNDPANPGQLPSAPRLELSSPSDKSNAGQASPLALPPGTTVGGIRDGRGKDDDVKTAIDPNRPAADNGKLAPIAMESVRAPIAAANISVTEIGTKVVPEDQAAKQANGLVPLPNGQERGFSYLTYRWQAANVCHWPLYFEEPMLERHGQQICPTYLQPAYSGTKFLSNLLLLPYKSTLQPPLESRYTLGHFRPGSAAPCLKDTLPWSTEAAIVQGAAVTTVAVGLPW